MWDIAWDLWDHRNRVVHDKDTGIQNTLANQQVWEEYILGPQGLTADTLPLFQLSRAAVLNMPLDARQAWVRQIQGSRTRYQQQEAQPGRALNPQQQLFHRWLSS